MAQRDDVDGQLEVRGGKVHHVVKIGAWCTIDIDVEEAVRAGLSKDSIALFFEELTRAWARRVKAKS